MVGKTVVISNPLIEVNSLSDIKNKLPKELVEIKMDFDTGVIGDHSYIIDINTAKIIASLMMGQEGGDITEASLSAICEVMNTISGNAMTTIGNQIKKDIRTSPPVAKKITQDELSFSTSGQLSLVTYNFKIDNKPGKFFEVFNLNVISDIAESVLPASNEMAQAYGGYSQTNKMGQQTMKNMTVQDRMSTQVQNVQFGSFNESTGLDNQSSGNINLLMDVTMDLTVELGRTKRSIKYILSMGEGTVLELDKLAGEPVDILVNGKLIARGEVVVIDENFGVRVTEIISPADRIQELT
jgi:flagellar motor switch protein FliN/FliY